LRASKPSAAGTLPPWPGDEPVRFVVLQDLDKTPGSFGRFTLYRWESTPNESSSPPGQISWTNLRLLYR